MLDQCVTECFWDSVVLHKDISSLILTLVVKFLLGEGENENISSEARGSFYQEELIYGVSCSYLVCLTRAAISTKIVLGLIHDNFI